MLKFLLAHMKPILSVSFLCGITPWILKFLDWMLTKAQKERFERWVDSLVPKLDSLHPNDLFIWAKTNRRKYKAILSISVFVLCLFRCSQMGLFRVNLFRTSAWHLGLLRDVAFALMVTLLATWLLLFFALITIDPVLNQPNLTAAFRYILRAFVTLIIAIPVLLFFGAVADALWVGGNAFKIATARLLQDGPLSLCFDIGKYVIYSVLVIYVPLVLLALLRFPISWASGAAWWLATHPKGAWTAMLLALTTALSLLKIMF